MKKLILFYFVIGLISNVFAQAEISQALSDSMQYALKKNIKITAVVVLKDQVNIKVLDKQLYTENANAKKRASAVIKTLQSKANSTQTSIKSFINNKSKTEIEIIESLWIINALLVKAKPGILVEISQRDDVIFMDIDHKSVPDPTFDEMVAPAKAPGSAEVGLRVVNAHKLWQMGYTGTGRLVMNRDTGVDGNHPALAWRWRGNYVPASWAWRGSGSFPVDGGSTGHGTHTMGTITGLDTLNQDTVGVAFEAQWIAADFSYSSISSFQWALNPDGDPNTIDDMPDVISNSWGISNSTGGCYQATYAATMNAVEAAGIAIVFSAGNDGPGAQTITGPKNINTDLVNSWATGNVDGNTTGYPIRSSSSRGPSGCGGTGSLLIKPEAVAPGVNVRSTIPGGGYGFKSGTSMACPHVAGVVTLLKQAFPNKTGHEIKLALYYTADETPWDLLNNDPGEDPGEGSGEDHTYGNGLIDAYAAYEYLAGVPNSPQELNAYSDYSTPNSMQLTWQNPTNLVNGDTLTSDSYQVFIDRDNVVIDSVFGGVDTYTDLNLEDGRLYHYAVYVIIDTSGLVGRKSEYSWIAGGSPIPGSATIASIGGGPEQIQLFWQNPATNVDGTPIDDFSQINLYQDSVLVTSFSRTTSDTGRADSATFIPPSSGIFQWYIAVEDNEVPSNESAGSNLVRSPLNIPIVEKFEPLSFTSDYIWRVVDAELNDGAINPSSRPYAVNINATPFGSDTLELYPVDLSGKQGTDLLFSFQYQPQGSGNEPPEPEDSLFLHFKNIEDHWIKIAAIEGDSLQPFTRMQFALDSMSHNYFHRSFQARISNIGTPHPFFARDEWYVDNIFLGEPQAIISADTNFVSFDTTMTGLQDTVFLEIQNIGVLDFNVTDVVGNGGVFNTDSTNFTVTAGNHYQMPINFRPPQTGTYQGIFKIVHDIPNADTLTITLFGVSSNISGVEEKSAVPKEFRISQNYPNPFNPVTTIYYDLPLQSEVKLDIYDILGKKIKSLINGKMKAGFHQVSWDGTNQVFNKVSSGIYIFKFSATNQQKNFNAIKKMILLK